MIFFRIINNKIIPLFDTPLVGWSKNQEHYLYDDCPPTEILVYRTALGVGDWVMLERLPYNIKKYYPECKVYLPSPKLIAETFGDMMYQWSSWGDVSKTVELVFKNNPYVDGYIDTWGEIYSDHYRIYDENKWDTPLVRQICRFYQIPDDFELDYTPQLYFDKVEIEIGENYLNNLKLKEFNFLHLSNRNTQDDEKIIYNYIKDHNFNNLPFLYYSNNDLNNSIFSSLELIENIKHIDDPRIQFYIKSKSNNVIGNQTGATDVVCGLTQVHSLHHSNNIEETWMVGNYLPPINYIKK